MGIFTQNNLPSQEESLKLIEETLLSMDVSSFTKEYSGDDIESLYFVITDKIDLSIRLPLCIEVIEKSLLIDYREIKRKDKLDIREKAERIALAELARYVETVSVMVKLGQTTLKESFLAFSYDHKHGKTIYQMIEEKGMKFLEE